MSGTALAPWAYHAAGSARNKTARMAESLHCDASSSERIRDCLMAATAEEVQAVDVALTMHIVSCPCRPTAEPAGPNAFLDRSPREAYAAGTAADVPFMTGFTPNEGCLVATPMIETPGILDGFDKDFNNMSPRVMLYDHLPPDVKREITSRIREFYFGSEPIGKWQLLDFMSDAFFIHSSLETVKLHEAASNSPLFLYRFAHTSDRSLAIVLGASNASHGVCHYDDMPYLFPMTTVFPQEGSPSDKALSQHFVNLVTQFADMGRPTADSSWQAVRQADHAEYMDLTEADSSTMQRDYEPQRAAFWKSLPVDIADCAAQ